MSPRALKIALAVSVALNLFAVGLAAGGVIVGTRLAEDRRAPRHHAFSETVSAMTPERRAAVRAEMRRVALAAQPDFREARETRRQAVEIAQVEPFDAARVNALLARSRAAEARARARLETGTVEILQTLSPADRAELAPTILSRRDHRKGRRGHGGGRHPGRDARDGSAPQAP